MGSIPVWVIAGVYVLLSLIFSFQKVGFTTLIITAIAGIIVLSMHVSHDYYTNVPRSEQEPMDHGGCL